MTENIPSLKKKRDIQVYKVQKTKKKKKRPQVDIYKKYNN